MVASFRGSMKAPIPMGRGRERPTLQMSYGFMDPLIRSELLPPSLRGRAGVGGR